MPLHDDKKAKVKLEKGKVNTKYITNERESIRRRMRKYFLEREYELADLEGMLTDVFCDEWCIFEKEYLQNITGKEVL